MKKGYQKVPYHQKARDCENIGDSGQKNFENIGLFSQKDYEERKFLRNL